MEFGEGDTVYLAVYNPYLEEQEHTSIFLNTSNVIIQSWYANLEFFYDVTSEAFCYSNPDNTTTSECEIFIKRKIAGLSTVIFKVTYDSNSNIAVKPSSSNSIENDLITLTLLNDSFNAGALDFLYNDIGGQKRVTFDIRYYLNYFK